jgi:CDP-paratose 2-epimerase
MKIIITGGAGFIGANAASRYLLAGHQVVILDNLEREGSIKNLEWLRPLGPFEFIKQDIRDASGVLRTFLQHRDADRVLHLAAQVAVTTSVADPRTDFETNALGTLNVLEAMRKTEMEAPCIYSSTNKVYGQMNDAAVTERDGRYQFKDLPYGVPESRNLDFHSPYGCSKGAADQYTLDYHRLFGLRTIVMRQSCIYGYRQFGAEDQGWLAWFMIAAQMGLPITVFGDGKQVRDILFIDDLLSAYDAAFESPNAAGRVYNLGGGPKNVLSLVDLIRYIEARQGRPLRHKTSDWRPGDQKAFVSDIRRSEHELNWSPRIGTERGMSLLYDWVAENLSLFQLPAMPAAVAGSSLRPNISRTA